MKLDKLAQIMKSVEIAERSKYLKAKAAKLAKPAADPNPFKVAKSKPKPLLLKNTVDKLEYAFRRMDLANTGSSISSRNKTLRAGARP